MNAISRSLEENSCGDSVSRAIAHSSPSLHRDPVHQACGRISGPRWFVVQSHSQAERLAAREIGEKGYRAYLPMQVTERRDRVLASLVHLIHVPLFSGYLFTEFDRDTDPWTPIRYCEGVKQIFMTPSQRPIAVPRGVIEALIDEAPTRLKLPEALMEPIEKGARVRINRGALVDNLGVCAGCDGRITQVKTSLFGGAVVSIPRCDIEII